MISFYETDRLAKGYGNECEDLLVALAYIREMDIPMHWIDVFMSINEWNERGFHMPFSKERVIGIALALDQGMLSRTELEEAFNNAIHNERLGEPAFLVRKPDESGQTV